MCVLTEGWDWSMCLKVLASVGVYMQHGGRERWGFSSVQIKLNLMIKIKHGSSILLLKNFINTSVGENRLKSVLEEEGMEKA